MSLIGVKNEQNPAVFVQVRYRERDEIGCLRLPTSAAKGANNAQKMSQFGANNVKKKELSWCRFYTFPTLKPVDFDRFKRVDFDTVVTSGQPSLF